MKVLDAPDGRLVAERSRPIRSCRLISMTDLVLLSQLIFKPSPIVDRAIQRQLKIRNFKLKQKFNGSANLASSHWLAKWPLVNAAIRKSVTLPVSDEAFE